MNERLDKAAGPRSAGLQGGQRFLLALFSSRVLGTLSVLCAVALHTNPYVAPGHEGYIYERPRVFGHGGFQGTVVGPGNFGLSLFRNEAVAIDMRPRTHSEKFELLAGDDLTLQFKFHAVISIEPGSVVRVVNEYGGLGWYPRFVAEPFRSFVRDAVQQYRSTDLKTTMDACARIVHEKLERYLEGTPFKLINLSVGDINYPAVVAQAVERKLAARQLLEERDTQRQIALKDAAIEVDRAKGKAEAQRIINSTLTSYSLQHEAIDARKKMAESPNHTMVYLPVGPTGSR